MSMKFLNQKDLATTALRRDALKIVRAGFEAVETAAVVRRAVSRRGNVLKIGRRTYRLDRFERVFVIGIGKASFEAVRALEDILGSRITDGVVLDVKGGALKHTKSLVGTHPFPSHTNIRATAEILGIVKGTTAKDLVVAVISGGGSSLLCWPHQLECDDVTRITQLLMHRGATIHELNTVRKHSSEIQGGQLAWMAHPATVAGLIFSDVPGDDISMVASGPTVLDTTTVKDARRIMSKYDVLRLCRIAHCDLRETPKEPRFFERVYNVLLVGNTTAIQAMSLRARDLGYHPVVYTTTMDGEARDAGRLLATLLRPGEALIAAGETTVTVRGKGKGGRNQELALGALGALPEGGLVLSVATDGIDNSPVAGALVDDGVRRRAAQLKLRPERFLERNDSLTFFESVGSTIQTGVTGVNVSDVMLGLLPNVPKGTVK